MVFESVIIQTKIKQFYFPSGDDANSKLLPSRSKITYNVGWVERFVLPNSVLGFVPQTPLPTTERHLLQPSCSS
ncbi:MAG: hypothetical protein AAFV71_28140, partial [Cyanobacteria bacterium J06633_8]